MIDSARSPSGQNLSGYSAPDFAHSPRAVFFEATQACDLVCRNCRARPQTLRHPRELNTAGARLLLRQIGEFPRPPLVEFTGGDPMKRPDLVELVRYGSRRGLEIALTVAATRLVTRKALARLARAGLRRVAIGLDGGEAEPHDRFRGVDGSYARTIEIIEWIHAEGLSLQVNTTVHPGLIPELESLARFVAGLGAAMWSLYFPVPVGCAAGLPRLSPEQYQTAFAILACQIRVQPYLIKVAEAPHFRRFLLEHDRPEFGPGVNRRA